MRKIESLLPKSKKFLVERIVFYKQFSSNAGDFVFFHLDGVDAAIERETDPYRVLSDKEPFIESFAYMVKGRVYLAPVIVREVDPGTGGYDLNLWDVFLFEGQKYVLICKREYEAHKFEAYRINKGAMLRELEFEFGGL